MEMSGRQLSLGLRVLDPNRQPDWDKKSFTLVHPLLHTEVLVSLFHATQANNVSIVLASLDGLTRKMKLATTTTNLTLEMKLTTTSTIAKVGIVTLKSPDLFGLGSELKLKKKLRYTDDVCTCIILGKELENAPINVLTTESVEKIASTFYYILTTTILDTEQCKELKMSLLSLCCCRFDKSS
ncbi:hypothetical protein OSB04_012621 [Centaurea solstitialis]|uniref:Uncharacterized protein n=1 Tax=Centaurea solstitialis TaxID=347529 RepID=A0AA38WE57_9ASTR|nr:hypothetical protein OSB04_012621 [Centaurea solstitialis]